MPIIGNFSSAGKKPTTPTIGTATDGGTGTSASVAFTASTYIGKSTITYTALSNPGSITGTGAGSPITVSGLTTGTAYTFTVKGDTPYGVASDYSAASNSVTPASPSSFESIATVTAAGGETSLSFTSIPNTYKSLQIRGISRYDGIDGAGVSLQIRFNSDTASNYALHFVRGNGSTTYAQGNASSTRILVDSGTYSGNNYFGSSIMDIIDYASTSKYKTMRYLSGLDSNSTAARIVLGSGLWMSTSAINTVEISVDGSYTFRAGSTFALYGVK